MRISTIFCYVKKSASWQQSGSRREGGSGPNVAVKGRLVYSLQNLKLFSSKEKIDIFWDNI